MTKLYAEIAKMEQQDDGTIKVWGYASSESVDSDGETITAAAMKAAIPDYMKFGAVREMHGKSAAGTAIEINVEDDGRTYFGAHIVDPVAVKKVQTGVYKGFSIGGAVTGRDDLNKSVITGVKLTEISLVDRPANPDAVFTCFKADKGTESEDDSKDEKAKGDDKADDKADDAKDGKSDDDKADEKDGKKAEKKDDEAEKAAFTPEEIEALRKMLKPQGDSLEKSMYQVKSLASLLQEVRWFIDSTKFDDDLPEDVLTNAKSAAKLLADALVLMVGEEVKAESGDAEKSDDAEDLAKAAVSEELAKVQAERDSLKAENEALKKQAAPPKGMAMAIGKAEDNGGEDPLQGFTPVVNADGSLNEAATLIKAAQSGRL